jgi:P27 family predicted phage terminase small subunit
MKNSVKPPSDLSKEGKAKWKKLQSEYGITDEAGMTYLTAGCRFYDRMRQAQATLALEGMTQTDRFGQVKPHPCAIIERDAAASMLRCFKALNLDIEPLRDKPGRPGGR